MGGFRRPPPACLGLTVTYLQIYTLLTVTLLNNSVELSSNLDPELFKKNVD